MGARGPKPKPNAVKIAKGTQPCRLNKGEVAAIPGLGIAPEWFDEASRKLWDRIVAEAPPGVLTVSDRWSVEQWIKLTAELDEMRQTIRRQGMVLTENRGGTLDDDGELDGGYTITKAHPLLPALANARKQWVAFADRFGFSASARASLSVEQSKPASALAQFMMSGGKKTDG